MRAFSTKGITAPSVPASSVTSVSANSAVAVVSEKAPLAGLHAVRIRADQAGDDPARCIDCHGGVGFQGKLRVKWLAARDALVWLGGDFEEPDGMNTPLLDEDCLQCHPSFDETPSGLPRPRFHELSVHNAELGVDCVQCHGSHDAGDPDFHYLDIAHVRSRCAECHNEFAQ